MKAAFYTGVEADYLRWQRLDREPGIDLIKCSDGLWRTAAEKAGFDQSVETQTKLIDIPSQITPHKAGS